MITAVAIAATIPAIARPDGPLHLGVITKVGIGLIFFLHGAKLSRDKLLSGAKLWKLHALTQSTTFIIFPLMGAILFIATKNILPEALRLGFFFLGALSSTVSSSVALTGMGRGNVPAAIFNATLSGLIGLVLTPIIVAIITSTESSNISLLTAIIDIMKTLLLPFILGQIARPAIGEILESRKKIVSMVDRGVILLIIFTSFAGAIYEGVFASFSIVDLAITVGLVLIMVTTGLAYTKLMARRLKLPRADEVTAVFCGATKSLANGAPIAQILFFGSADLAMIMLPLLLYHQSQLIVCATLAQKYASSEPVESRSASS